MRKKDRINTNYFGHRFGGSSPPFAKLLYWAAASALTHFRLHERLWARLGSRIAQLRIEP